MIDDSFIQTLVGAVDELEANDPERMTFGASVHRYQRQPPLSLDELAAIEDRVGAELPAQYRSVVTGFGNGGVGPYYGLMPVPSSPLERGWLGEDFDPTRTGPGWPGGIGLCHMGCDVGAFMPVRGEHAGEVWLDVRATGQGMCRGYASLFEFFADWMERAAAGKPPAPWVRKARCALPAALSGYFQAVEQAAGMSPGTLAGTALTEALARIPTGGIAIASSGTLPWFALGQPVGPCVACVQLIDDLGLGIEKLAKWSYN